MLWLGKAREKGELAEFTEEHEKTHPRASHKHFHGVISSMASQKKKPKKGTSRKGVQPANESRNK